MARKVSPFAALTSEEKQIKWMEYQTIRLPYTQVEDNGWQHQRQDEQTNEPTNTNHAGTANEQPRDLSQDPPSTNMHTRPIPPPEVFVASPGKQRANSTSTNPQPSPVPSAYQQINEYQKSRHRQYDAVIERMKQAERNTGSFCAWSK